MFKSNDYSSIASKGPVNQEQLSSFSGRKKNENHAPELSNFQAGIDCLGDYPSFHLSSATMMDFEDPNSKSAKRSILVSSSSKIKNSAEGTHR